MSSTIILLGAFLSIIASEKCDSGNYEEQRLIVGCFSCLWRGNYSRLTGLSAIKASSLGCGLLEYESALKRDWEFLEAKTRCQKCTHCPRCPRRMNGQRRQNSSCRAVDDRWNDQWSSAMITLLSQRCVLLAVSGRVFHP
ncbi:hypothetical protein AVEN_221155-1 [Araneus ventricosus]|uniref:Secreted protein n=1 Tax=Araneus ventricosus TaxID=182803 RepID=A0A4Y2EQB2_ARAVE|nr:hypothetical protein AVEN_137022-1 [Araneus ventricosus]GBM31432.1 hypothetical protein AVEN_221155-1 [Araneus ventricosus]